MQGGNQGSCGRQGRPPALETLGQALETLELPHSMGAVALEEEQ